VTSALLLAHVAATMRRWEATLRDGRDHVHQPDRLMTAPVLYARCVTCGHVMRGEF
jgi:hypothetical protein